MLLTEYISNLVKVIDEYSKTNLIIDSELSAYDRTEKISIVKGSVTFADNSILVFTKYLNLKYKIACAKKPSLKKTMLSTNRIVRFCSK